MSAENVFPATDKDKKTSNHATFKSLTSIVCSCLSQMGDNSLVFVILEKVILEQIVSWLTFMQFCYYIDGPFFELVRLLLDKFFLFQNLNAKTGRMLFTISCLLDS